MTIIDVSIKNIIINSLENILNIQDNNWNNLESNIKIKIIHHYCNLFNKKKSNINWDIISIPLKSLKPKKIIQFTGINNNNNKILFNDFNNQILQFTNGFREQFNKKSNPVYLLSSLDNLIYNKILNNYAKIVFDFINKNIKCIKTTTIYNNLVSNNNDKLIIKSSPTNFNILLDNSNIHFVFDNNIKIICKLEFYSDKITNNIPVKFSIKLINNF
jgi:hypothetical protein